ncbi:uncharacterized protein TrAFT101_008617 [Trichoderma asperellum]|uniref:MARVEL domain-containing protein n=1 Tax=Trichoderma asperellum (strain ATCC 204424 / CBS 433.97 / NBRC 101777) TaxID=1042311 RepID=A0A2T3ZBW5_TRIA4|nr:hypothetical protein M441DRAFT_67829 [Trichoderma asperellum CBS 433.97]PTB42295.1 hypothetical protein M441DRAFT_67829 [Trichoderma asperellum CBS 433.97]UKZ93708.1 hypothetical protein TrAFT101_008617 [Trichoderma asperellum]
MALVEIDPQILPNLKLSLHSFQIILAFLAWCLEIAVFRGDTSRILGTNGWTFAVCFLSIPAWIYLVMTPRFGRTRRFANPYIMLAVDGLFIIIWISAFSTQAAYNSSGSCGGSCGISKAIVAVGVFVTLLWIGTTFLSAYTLQYYNFHGTLPGYDSRKISGSENIDPDKAAFSMAPHDEEAYERVNMDDHDGPGAYDDHNTSMNSRYGDNTPYNPDDFDDPNRYGALPPRTNSTPLFDSETEYHGSALGTDISHHKTPSPGPYSGNHADTYADGPVQFPTGHYDRIES